MKKENLDFWAGHVLANCPSLFLDLEMEKFKIGKSFNILCKNCKKLMLSEI
jgi:hypothetical protein